MKLVGITGGIGSGKTTVARFFEELGIPLYIADDEAKRLMHSNPIKSELIDLFGPSTYDADGNLDRPFLAKQVFNNKERLDKLNGIVHPRVAEDFKDWVARQDAPYILYEAAILFETGRYEDFDYTILVTAPEAERIKRVKKRDKSTEKEIKSRIDNQWSDEKKAKLADFIIKNLKLNETKNEVHKLHNFLLEV